MLKGAGKLTHALFAVLAVALFTAIMFMVISGTFEDLAKQIAQESSEVVAKDIAAFLTVSGAAPEDITITYKPSTKFSYDVEIKDRFVGIKSLFDNEYTEGARILVWKLGPISWEEKTAVDAKTQGDIKNTKTFVITKTVDNGKYVYKIKSG